MKIKAEILLKFIERINLTGTIEECRLNFTSTGVKVEAKETKGVLAIRGNLAKEQFIEYEEIGLIGIQNITKFITILRRFVGTEVIDEKEKKTRPTEVTIVKEGTSVLCLKSAKREFKFILPDIEYIAPVDLNKIDKIPFDEEVVLELDVFKDGVVDAGVLKVEETILDIKGNIIEVIVGDDQSFTERLKLSKPVSTNIKLKLPSLYNNVINSLEKPTTFKFGTKSPLMLINKDNGVDFTYVIAPKILEE